MNLKLKQWILAGIARKRYEPPCGGFTDAEVSDRANFSGEKRGRMNLSGGYRCSRNWCTAHPDLR